MTEVAEPSVQITGKILSRTSPGEEFRLPQWTQLISDIQSLATTANALMCIQADAGSGRTTFLSMLKTQSSPLIDNINIAPASPTTGPGWLLDALIPWLSSDTRDTRSVQRKLAALAESSRPVLICVDTGDLIQGEHLVGDLSAILNLADSCGLRLSVLICGGESTALAIASDQRAASRLIFRNNLPRFTENQISDLLLKKISTLNTTKKIQNHSVDKISRDCGGNPLRALKSLAVLMGGSIPQDASPTKKTKESTGNSKKDVKSTPKKTDLTDLLAPAKT